MAVRLTIIGAGPGGYVAAIRAAQLGARVTIIEDAEVGGVCLNWGCIPTKTLVYSADLFNRVRHADEFGIDISGAASYNLSAIRGRKEKVVSTQVKGIRSLLKSWGVDLIIGRGSILSSDVVRSVQKDGTTQDIKSDRIIIATGSRPATPSIFTFDHDRVMTSDDAVRFDDVPKSLLIVGAGVIGCEFAFIYRFFGTDVTVVEMLPRALSTEDEEISEIVEREMKKARIKLITNAAVKSAEVGPDGLMRTTLASGQAISTEKILVSIGRSMNTEGIGLESVGIETGKRGEIIVNDRMETNLPGIYAIGDVTGKMMLAHVASHQGIIAAENALGGDWTMDYSAVPSAIFTMPEVGSVGLREYQAREKGIAVKTGRFQFRGLGKAHAMGEIVGMAKVVSDADTGRVLGVHICGPHATDIIHEAALAMRLGAKTSDISEMVHAHPTLSEALMEASLDVSGMSIHTPKQQK